MSGHKEAREPTSEELLVVSRKLLENILQFPCDYCQKPEAPLLCSSCKSVNYCNKECQKLAWKRDHKQKCMFGPIAFQCIQKEFEKLDAFLLVYEKFQKEGEQEDKVRTEQQLQTCCICLEKKNSSLDFLQLPCHHVYCIDCIAKAEIHRMQFHFSCPLCRTRLKENLVTYTEWAIQEMILQADYYEYYEVTKAVYYTEKGRAEHYRLERLVERYPSFKEEYFPYLQLYHTRLSLLEKKYDDVLALCLELKDNATLNQESIKRMEVIYCYGVALEGLGEYRGATGALYSAYSLIRKTDDFKSIHRKILNHICHCAYQMKDDALLFTTAAQAIELNEQFDTIFELMCRYYQEKEDWTHARLCLKAAIQYECPWKPAHREMMKDKLKQFDEQRAQAIAIDTAASKDHKEENL